METRKHRISYFEANDSDSELEDVSNTRDPTYKFGHSDIKKSIKIQSGLKKIQLAEPIKIELNELDTIETTEPYKIEMAEPNTSIKDVPTTIGSTKLNRKKSIRIPTKIKRTESGSLERVVDNEPEISINRQGDCYKTLF